MCIEAICGNWTVSFSAKWRVHSDKPNSYRPTYAVIRPGQLSLTMINVPAVAYWRKPVHQYVSARTHLSAVTYVWEKRSNPLPSSRRKVNPVENEGRVPTPRRRTNSWGEWRSWSKRPIGEEALGGSHSPSLDGGFTLGWRPICTRNNVQPLTWKKTNQNWVYWYIIGQGISSYRVNLAEILWRQCWGKNWRRLR